jgi:twitching motility protein PilT
MRESKKKSQKLLLGEVFLEYGIITQDQLRKALDRQAQVGGHIGSILEEMGYLDGDSLLSFLSKQLNTPSMNLFKTKIASNVLNFLPFEKVKAFKVVPIKEVNTLVTLAMVNPNDISAIQDVEFALGRQVEPVVVPFYQMEEVIAYFTVEGYGNKTFDGEVLRAKTAIVKSKAPTVYSLLKLVLDFKGTDLLITAGVPPSVRVDSDLKRLSMSAVTPEQMSEYTEEILTKEQQEIFEREKELDFAISVPDTGRFRMNMYRQRNSISLAARFIVEDIPSLKQLVLPEWIKDYALKKQGFILIAGPTGHGKTTTMSALVDVINSNRKCNIVTLEDPIEYLHRHKKSNVNQREVGVDTESFAVGLKHVFRQDPDVIIIGEMRDPESIAIALTAAETGHLVISTLHTLNATTAIDRIIDIFPGHQQHQVRLQFADSFLLVFAQRLVPKKIGKGRILAYEKMANSFRVRNLIREGKTPGIRSLMQVVAEDIASIDQSLAKLCLQGEISLEDGLKFADNPPYYQDLVKLGTPK